MQGHPSRGIAFLSPEPCCRRALYGGLEMGIRSKSGMIGGLQIPPLSCFMELYGGIGGLDGVPKEDSKVIDYGK